MAMATYWQRGEALDYVNNSTDKLAVGSVVKLEGRVGVAGDTIMPRMKGILHVSGVYKFSKTSTNEIKMGTAVYFDDTGITEASGGTPAGYAAETASANAKEILVKIG